MPPILRPLMYMLFGLALIVLTIGAHVVYSSYVYNNMDINPVIEDRPDRPYNDAEKTYVLGSQ